MVIKFPATVFPPNSVEPTEYYRKGRAAVWASVLLSTLAMLGASLVLPALIYEIDEMKQIVEAEAAVFKSMSDDLWSQLMAIERQRPVGHAFLVSDSFNGDGGRVKRHNTFLDRLERKSYKGRLRALQQKPGKAGQYGPVAYDSYQIYEAYPSPKLSTLKMQTMRRGTSRSQSGSNRQRQSTTASYIQSAETATASRVPPTTITLQYAVKSVEPTSTVSSAIIAPYSSTTSQKQWLGTVDENANQHFAEQVEVKLANEVGNGYGQSASVLKNSLKTSRDIVTTPPPTASTKSLERSRCLLKGPPGPRGRNGVPGLAGKPGDVGRPGRSGNDWAQADFGSCIKCPQGPPGEAGVRGPPGTPGLPGVDGIPGQMSAQDKRKGPSGPVGDAGEPGPDGENGMPGPPGDDQIKFLKGEPGERGVPGIAGSIGEPGDRGADGLPGELGEIGFVGQMGLPGKNGAPGVPGIPGEAGYPGIDRQYCNCPVRSLFIMALKQQNVDVSQYLNRFKKQRDVPKQNDGDFITVYEKYNTNLVVPYYRIM